MYEVIKEEVYTSRLEKAVSVAKTSLQTLEIDDEKITEQIVDIARFRARVIQDEAEVKNALELLEAVKRTELRKSKASVGEKVTERCLDDLITMDAEVQELRSKLRNMQKRFNVVDALFTAISISKRMFIERNKQKLNHLVKGDE